MAAAVSARFRYRLALDDLVRFDVDTAKAKLNCRLITGQNPKAYPLLYQLTKSPGTSCRGRKVQLYGFE